MACVWRRRCKQRDEERVRYVRLIRIGSYRPPTVSSCHPRKRAAAAKGATRMGGIQHPLMVVPCQCLHRHHPSLLFHTDPLLLRRPPPQPQLVLARKRTKRKRKKGAVGITPTILTLLKPMSCCDGQLFRFLRLLRSRRTVKLRRCGSARRSFCTPQATAVVTRSPASALAVAPRDPTTPPPPLLLAPAAPCGPFPRVSPPAMGQVTFLSSTTRCPLQLASPQRPPMVAKRPSRLVT